jgi:hypothetical protein|tara:strand:- start:123 stop:401 length:279 start_codon:yes stop_codon:yes gene_type:complete
MNDIAEALKVAKAAADVEHSEWVQSRAREAAEWAELGYGKPATPKLNAITSLVKDNWGKIATVGAAFGLPLGVADPGAFAKVLGVLGNIWPF